MAAKISKVMHFHCDVSDKQHSELLELVCSINKNGSKAIDELCAEGDRVIWIDNNPLREVWHQDIVERLENHKYMYYCIAGNFQEQPTEVPVKFLACYTHL